MIWGPIYRSLYHFFLRALPSWETSFWHLWIGKYMHAWVLAKSLQLCPALCNPMDCSLAGSSVHGILQATQYWSGLPCLSPGDLPNPEIEPTSPGAPALQVTSWPLIHQVHAYNTSILTVYSEVEEIAVVHWIGPKLPRCHKVFSSPPWITFRPQIDWQGDTGLEDTLI